MRDGLAVIKVGGSLSRVPGAMPRLGSALAAAAQRGRILVIPGGGCFTDSVRKFEATHGLTAHAAHWMAILGMDQFAHAIAAHTPAAVMVHEMGDIPPAQARGEIPVLAPYRWLRAADELPHTWEVTSDSLSAYLAGLLGAELLVLVKPVAGDLDELVDGYFARSRPASLRVRILGLMNLEQLPDLLVG
jgi:aspartokinase-like uncharacterized kinase